MCVSFRNTHELMVKTDGNWFFKKLMVKNLTFPRYNPLHNKGLLSKAGEAIRTPDFHVGNVTLYH